MPLRPDLQTALGTAYAVERELGGGGMSQVFLAEERALGRKVVVKVLPDELAGSVSAQRFKREIALAARLHHPHIVPVLTAGETEGEGRILYYTMPFVDGESLRERLQRGPMAPVETVRVLREVATALGYAHAHRVVHRDIKPENILLAGGVATVTDFGVAKALASAATAATAGSASGSATLTSVGVTLGTPAYMAPEQAAADPAVDHRADLYSLGCVAYEMLTGAPPFSGSALRVLAAQVTETPAPIDTRRTPVPAGLVALTKRLLAKSPDERPQTADDLVRALDALIITNGGWPARASLRLPSRRWLAALAALLVMLTLGVAFARRGARIPGDAAQSRSIGIVPFENLSADRDNEYFSEGITQEIADALGKVPGLRIAEERSSRSSRGDARDSRAIGRALGVETVLHGSVQRAGDHVHITARLVNAADGYQIWSDRYDRDFRDVFAVQDELARAIVAGLQLRLVAGVQGLLMRPGTANPEAHRLYLLGMYQWNRRTTATLHKAMDTFRQAVRLDSSYAAPYAGLGLAYAVLVDYEDVDVSTMSDSAAAAGRAALARDSTSSDAWTAIARAHANRFENRAALEAFAHAVALDPNNARAHQWYAETLAHVQRFDEARREIYRARDLEPVTLIINVNVGRVALAARRYAEAEAALRHAIELDSAFYYLHPYLATAYLAQGKPDSALAEFERVPRLAGRQPARTTLMLGYLQARIGRTGEARATLAEVERLALHGPMSYGSYALLLWEVGEKDRAVAALDTAVARYDPIFRMRSTEEIFDHLRADRRTAGAFARAEAQ